PPPPSAPLPAKSPSVAKPSRGATKPSSAAVRGTPIIMVPSGLTSLVTMYNIKDLLERGVFTSSETLRQQGAPKPERMRVRRTVGRATPVEYTVTDREPRCKEEWERVVAVFCSGKVWQFKQWPYKGAAQGDMVETFHKVCGFYLHFHDEKVDPMIRKWNVKTLPLHRESRHRDVAVVQELYAALDRRLQARRCKLVY
ncbi:Cdc73 RNA pol II accessory factor, partial [Helicosporidium sp. ATCC 50920]